MKKTKRKDLNVARENLSNAIEELEEGDPTREAAVKAIQEELDPDKLDEATKAIAPDDIEGEAEEEEKPEE